jgi:hypothetical protein
MQPSCLAEHEIISPDINVLKFFTTALCGFHDDDETFSQTVGIDFSAKAVVGVFYLREMR